MTLNICNKYWKCSLYFLRILTFISSKICINKRLKRRILKLIVISCFTRTSSPCAPWISYDGGLFKIKIRNQCKLCVCYKNTRRVQRRASRYSRVNETGPTSLTKNSARFLRLPSCHSLGMEQVSPKNYLS